MAEHILQVGSYHRTIRQRAVTYTCQVELPQFGGSCRLLVMTPGVVRGI
jgi:hypothetical protein